MENQFWIRKNTIDEKKNIWNLEVAGGLLASEAGEKLRILAVFRFRECIRRFPMEAMCFEAEEKRYFAASAQISLPDVFYQAKELQDADQVCVTFSFCDREGMWQKLGEEVYLSGQYFKPKSVKTSFGYRLYRKVSYVCCTLLLPIWLLNGYFAGKGYIESPYLKEGERGKRAMLYHAHGLVQQITGYGYSVREWKTRYFASQYQKACKKVKPVHILFLSERQPDIGGNLDCIRKSLLQAGEDVEEFIDTRPVHKLPFSQIRKAAGKAAAAKVIVLEDFYPQLHALSLRRETEVIQLWHACGAFKMFGLSDIGKVQNLKQDTKNHRSYTAAIVSSKQMVPFYSEAFGIAEKSVLPLGVPRTDIFFDEGYREEIQKKLYEKYPQLFKKKVVLFAPTFRGGGNKDAYYPPERFLVDDFLEQLSKDTVLIIKNHPFVKQHFPVSEKNKERVLDLTGKENINDLLFVTDLLITDYSSSIFEASLLSVPMLFYVFDLDEYMCTRDIYFDFAAFVPGTQVQDLLALTKEAKRILSEGSAYDLKRFRDYFLGSLDGHSTERVTAWVRQHARTCFDDRTTEKAQTRHKEEC